MKNMRRLLWLLVLLTAAGMNRLMAQIASFSFSTASTVSGWTRLTGDPASSSSPQTATMNGITISSIGSSSWVPNSLGSCIISNSGPSSATYFPTAVMDGAWCQWNGNTDNLALYNASQPQLKL